MHLKEDMTLASQHQRWLRDRTPGSLWVGKVGMRDLQLRFLSTVSCSMLFKIHG
jgi:hypothetical protein